jgi:hypothetical protein
VDFIGDLREQVKEGSGDGASLCMGLWEGNWGGSPLLGTLKDMYKKALVTSISLHGGTGRGDFERGERRLWTQCLFLWELCEGTWRGGGGLYWRLWRTCQGRLWKRSISLLIEAPWGELGGRAPIPKTPRHVIEGSEKGAFLFYRSSIRGTERYLEREG